MTLALLSAAMLIGAVLCFLVMVYAGEKARQSEGRGRKFDPWEGEV